MADLVRAWKRAVHDPEVAALRATICNKDARIAELEAALRRARAQIIEQQAMPDPPTWIDQILAAK